MTNALWYLGRGFGVSAVVLFSAVVVLGIVVRNGRAVTGLPKFAVVALHRTLSLTALGFVALHITTLLFDPYAQLRLTDILIPFDAPYRPVWQGLGTLAFDLVVLLVVSSLLRDRIGRRVWRAVHWLAYAFWPLAVAHAIGNGTDGTSRWMLVLNGGCLLAVAGAVSWRVLSLQEDVEVPVVPAPVAPRGVPWT